MPAKGILIGLAGKARSGKDMVGDHLNDRYDFMRYAFATTLKDVVRFIFGFNHDQIYGDLKEVVDPRVGKSPRYCLQYVGTEIARACWPEVWIWHLCSRIEPALAEGTNVAVTDIRLKNEAQMIKDLGGYLIRVNRVGAQASNGVPNHSSETDLDNWEEWDLVIDNNGSLEELYDQVDRFINALRRAA